MASNEHTTGTDRDNKPVDSPLTKVPDDPFTNGIPTCMTLEGIVTLTDELPHLNELVMLHLEKSGGFTNPATYFTIVTPVLDMLEVEIRCRYQAGMSKDRMKLIVQDWIDKEIAGLKSRGPAVVPAPDPEHHD